MSLFYGFGLKSGSNNGGLVTGDNIDMKGYEIKNLGDPTTQLSAVNKKWVEGKKVHSTPSPPLSVFTTTGDIDMGGNYINSVGKLGSNPSSVPNVLWVSDNFLYRNNNINMNDYEVKNLGDPTTPLSAVNRKWVKDKFSSMKSAFTMKGDINMGGNEVNHLGDPTTPLSVVMQ
jgi:hypothetical protein